MKRVVLVLTLCSLFSLAGYAQQSPADQPATKEDVQRYLDAMHTRELMRSTMDAMAKQMRQMTHDQVVKQPNLPPDFETRMNKMTDGMFKDMPVDELLDAMIPVYQKHLTKGDIDALAAFYSTPTGQKIVKEMPALVAESMQAAQGITQKMIASAMQRVQDEVAQAAKESEASPVK